jgi:drug/metabolite transporter (DMT)-like permease
VPFYLLFLFISYENNLKTFKINLFIFCLWLFMTFGSLLVLAACFIWGLVFVIPGWMPEYSPIEVALGRYFCYGAISLFIFGVRFKGMKANFSFRVWQHAFLFAFVANILYYSTLVLGIRFSNASVTALIFGISPLTIAFYGNWVEKECSFKAMFIPSFLILFGLLCVNLPALKWGSPNVSFLSYGLGLSCAFVAHGAWSWYVVANSRFLKNHPAISPSEWSTILGVATFCTVIVCGAGLASFAASPDLEKYTQWNASFFQFVLGSLILGAFCSWLAFYLWNRACHLLPVSFAGQLTIFETIFGLIFVYVLENRFPAQMELMGILCILCGIFFSLKAYQKKSLTA